MIVAVVTSNFSNFINQLRFLDFVVCI